MLLYSFKGQEPDILPFRVRLDDGLTRTSLNELSASELEYIGFVGPITKPKFDDSTQKIEWNGSAYDVIQLTDEEILERSELKKSEEIAEKIKNINYHLFWEKLVSSKLYKKIRLLSLQSLPVNTLCTELISFFADAKSGIPNHEMIQKYINILFLNFDFSVEEIEEIKTIINETNLDCYYSIPDEEYLSSYVYSIETNEIIEKSPFESWTLVNGEWQAPVQYPNDGKIYNWNEDLKNWIEY